MLIRFAAKNILSFGDEVEFNMLPKPKYARLNHHKYKLKNIELLKLTALYGANGAGKSNLASAIRYLKDLVLQKVSLTEIISERFKFFKDGFPQILAIEFLVDNRAYYYAIEVKNGFISTEELYYSGLGKKEDELIFERETDENGKTEVRFFEEFENDEKGKVLKSVLLDGFILPDETTLKAFSNRGNNLLKSIDIVYNWFLTSLVVLFPYSKPMELISVIEQDKELKKFAENILCSFNIGIKSLKINKRKLKKNFQGEFAGDFIELLKDIDSSEEKKVNLQSESGDMLEIQKIGEDYIMSSIVLEHEGKNGKKIEFELSNESDGTIRLLDLIPAISEILNQESVVIIDEIERSIHPLLIKELVKKFSEDKNTKGQLIFTTHETNLLDQEILRQDEIWFVEKNLEGMSEFYSLSDYKEHNTIDIRKGYLNGRYGAIPFLGNLQDLNWGSNAADK